MSTLPSCNRTESDALGPIEIPASAYYGPQTARAILNFPVSGVSIARFPVLVHALAYVKKAAASANRTLGILDSGKAELICQVCDEIIAGLHIGEFPVDVLQGGAGTSTNMNMNEVIANRALELMGQARGRYDLFHPNNDVNLSQSTNDVYPTTIRLAVFFSQRKLLAAMEELATAFESKGDAFADVMKLGRTQLQDAVPMTLGLEFHAFAATIREDMALIGNNAKLLLLLNIGGTAIGTGINTVPGYRELVISELGRLTDIPVVPTSNLIGASWDTSDLVTYSGGLKRAASKLSKICNDLRLLSSGPRGGFSEITLPAVQPGSSIMPGKVNPVIPEAVNQVAFQIIGHDLTVTLASEAGQLQLNAMEPVMAYSILQSLDLLANAAVVLRDKCVTGIVANESKCLNHLEASTAIVTGLLPIMGYDRASELAKEVLKSNRSISELLYDRGELSQDLISRLADLGPWLSICKEGSKQEAGGFSGLR